MLCNNCKKDFLETEGVSISKGFVCLECWEKLSMCFRLKKYPDNKLTEEDLNDFRDYALADYQIYERRINNNDKKRTYR